MWHPHGRQNHPLVEAAQIPLVAFSPGQRLREPLHPHIVNIRASYREEVKEVIDHLIRDAGLSRVAVFYQDDEYGRDGLEGPAQRSAGMDWSRLGRIL